MDSPRTGIRHRKVHDGYHRKVHDGTVFEKLDPQGGGRCMIPRKVNDGCRIPAAEMLRIKLSHYRCQKDTAVRLVEWVVISFDVIKEIAFST